jgi:gamma-glutamylputrescine oxidase
MAGSSASPSAWLNPPTSARAKLTSSEQADVVVIGAGFTGLSAALALRREGFDVAVLEADYVGFGASGRNAGHLTPQIGKDLPTLLRLYSHDRVRALLGLVDRAIQSTEDLISSLGLECDYEPVGNILAAVHPGQFRSLDRAAEAAKAFSVDSELLEPESMRQRGLPGSFLRGLHERAGGLLDPGRYVTSLARAAEAEGVRIFERSAVLGLEEGPRLRVRTKEGSVDAPRAVVAVNAYGLDLPLPGKIARAALPIYVQLFRTEPLTSAQLSRVGWAGRQGVYTCHEILESWRLTADNSIIGGSKFIRYGYGGGRLRDRDGLVSAGLERVFRTRFPELTDVAVAKHWGGRIAMALDFLPAQGCSGRYDNIFYSLGYAGHGLALASHAGSMIADLMAGRHGPSTTLADRWSVGLPPEPLRWLAFQGLVKYFAAVDRRVDRQLG